MRTQKTVQKRLEILRKKQSELAAKHGYNAGHDFLDLIKELEWVLNVKPTKGSDQKEER